MIGRAVEERGQRAALDAVEFRSAQEASVALARLLNVTRATTERAAHLQRALDSRVVIEQAKGVLAERFALDVDDAFALLRRAARSHGLRIRVLAEEVVSSRETPAPIAKVARTWTPSENAESA
jgi:AmiR/NasT family two-component response regulator